MVSRVSVVVPTIGRLESLRECLLAISRQSYEPFEVLVVHDGNNRHLVKQVVASFGAIYIPGLGRGVIEAYNTAVRYAKGDIIAFTDDDAIPGPRWLEEMVALYTEGVGAVGGAVKSKDDTQPCLVTTKVGSTGEFTGWQLITVSMEVDHLRGANMSFARDAMQETGIFDPNFGGDGYMFESDYCLRMKKKGYRILFNPNAIVFHMESKERKVPRGRSPSRRYHHRCNKTYFMLKHCAVNGNNKTIIRRLFRDATRSLKSAILNLDGVYICSFAGTLVQTLQLK
jgi:GT2 family glycosyltransferase